MEESGASARRASIDLSSLAGASFRSLEDDGEWTTKTKTKKTEEDDGIIIPNEPAALLKDANADPPIDDNDDDDDDDDSSTNDYHSPLESSGEESEDDDDDDDDDDHKEMRHAFSRRHFRTEDPQSSSIEDSCEQAAAQHDAIFHDMLLLDRSSLETASEMDASINTNASSSSSGSWSHFRRRHQSTSSSAVSSTTLHRQIPETIEEGGGNRLRASLDAGMASLRRWIRSRNNQQQQQQRASRTTLRLGEEDIFALTHPGSMRDDTFVQASSEHQRRAQPHGRNHRRVRALSEPEGRGLRDYFFQRATLGSSPPSSGSLLPTRFIQQDNNNNNYNNNNYNNNYNTTVDDVLASPQESAPTITNQDNENANNSMNDSNNSDDDPHGEARTRWMRINRRFQLTISIVALIFSILLFAILVCWVVLTSSYVVAIDKTCDVPLKSYFWLATLQLILDVFRTDIMRCFLRYDVNNNRDMPVRVIIYNIAYLIYALLVLRQGINSVFLSPDSTCKQTASQLYQSSKVFVSLSIAAWSTILFGYLVPFCCVAMLLTWNGYNPAADANRERANAATLGFGGVLPSAYTNSGAPPGVVDQLRTVLLEEFPEDYPKECCICMSDFAPGEVIVATDCDHVFHKRCCQEWLRHARTCPVCRTDICDARRDDDAEESVSRSVLSPFPGREEFHTEVVNLLQILRQHEQQGNEDFMQVRI